MPKLVATLSPSKKIGFLLKVKQNKHCLKIIIGQEYMKNDETYS